MRLEATSKEDLYKCWLTDDDLKALRRAARSHRDDLVIQFGGSVRLRAFEIPQVAPKHVKRTPDGDHFRLRLSKGKDTTGSGGKPCDVYLPREVEGDIHRYVRSEDASRHESIGDLSESSIQAVVKRTADATGNGDFRHVSSHDLRRWFAQRLLVDKQVNPRVVIQVGGWDSFQATEPYLNVPTTDVVNGAFEKPRFV